MATVVCDYVYAGDCIFSARGGVVVEIYPEEGKGEIFPVGGSLLRTSYNEIDRLKKGEFSLSELKVLRRIWYMEGDLRPSFVDTGRKIVFSPTLRWSSEGMIDADFEPLPTPVNAYF